MSTETITTETQETTGTVMNVYTALSKRKILQKQIDEALSDSRGKVCAAVFASADKINGKSREDAINDMKAAYDRPRQLIANIRKINSAIAISNATTKVIVAGKEYTVEELLYRSVHISDELRFYDQIVKDLNDARIAIEANRTKNLSESVITDHVTKLLPTMVSADASADEREKQATTIRETYIKNMTMELIDPYNLLAVVTDKIREINEFKEDLDNALNLSNIQTTITVDLE